jgi:hypothetical protein
LQRAGQTGASIAAKFVTHFNYVTFRIKKIFMNPFGGTLRAGLPAARGKCLAICRETGAKNAFELATPPLLEGETVFPADLPAPAPARGAP